MCMGGFYGPMHNARMDALKSEIAAVAARLVVEEGLEMGAAKRRAVKQMGLGTRTPLPDNEMLMAQVEDYIALFCSDTQPGELHALRELAVLWMERLAEFRPHLTGAVWNGTATRRSDILLQLFCDDPKSAEIGLIDKGVRFDCTTIMGFRGDPVDALSVHVRCLRLGTQVGLHLLVHDLDDLRGALVPDGKGRRWRGDVTALRRLMHDGAP